MPKTAPTSAPTKAPRSTDPRKKRVEIVRRSSEDAAAPPPLQPASTKPFLSRPRPDTGAEEAPVLHEGYTLWDAAVNIDWCSSRSSNENSHIAATLSKATGGVLHPGIRIPSVSNTAESVVSGARFMSSSSTEAPFRRGEIVIVPHPRGGFVCAAVDGILVAPRCCVDPSVPHRSNRIRVAYRSASKTILHTDIQPFLIGRFLGVKPSPKRHLRVNKKNMDAKGAESKRQVGMPLTEEDCATVRFSSRAHLSPGQVVAVPRSSGGFTYGTVLEAHDTLCTIDIEATHDVGSWRIEINVGHGFKDLPTSMVGFFPSSDQRPNPQKPALAFSMLKDSHSGDFEDSNSDEAVAAAFDGDDDDDDEIDAKQEDKPEEEEDERELGYNVVIDGKDIGCSFSFDKRMISTGGLMASVDFFEQHGCNVKVFIPASTVLPVDSDDDFGQQDQLRVDDISYIEKLQAKGQLVTSPLDDPKEYLRAYDAYCRDLHAYPVTNAVCDDGSTEWVALHALHYSTDMFDFNSSFSGTSE